MVTFPRFSANSIGILVLYSQIPNLGEIKWCIIQDSLERGPVVHQSDADVGPKPTYQRRFRRVD